MEQSQKQYATPTPGVSVAQLVRDIKEGVKESFHPKYTNYLRSFTSSLKHEFPNRVYKVSKLDEKTEVSWTGAND